MKVVVAALTLMLTATACGGTQEAVANKRTPKPAYTQDPAATVYPDLVMSPVRDFRISVEHGERRLRYSFVIVNAGTVPFWITASRNDPSEKLSLSQRLYRPDGTWQDRPTVAGSYYAGDGHDHWHVRDLAWVQMFTPDGTLVKDGHAKHGFCFYDTQRELPGTPNSPEKGAFKEAGCEAPTDTLSYNQALSPGWGDEYSYDLPDQYIDVTDVPDGRYRVQVVADQANWFTEASDDNNAAWTDIEIKGTQVEHIDFYRGGPVLPDWVKNWVVPTP